MAGVAPALPLANSQPPQPVDSLPQAQASVPTPAASQISAAAANPTVPPNAKRGAVYKRMSEEVALVNKKMAEFQACRKELDGLKERLEAASDKIYVEEKKKQDIMASIDRDVSAYQLKVVQVALSKQKKTAVDSMEMGQLNNLKRQRDYETQQEKQRLEREVSEKVDIAARFKDLEFQEKYAALQAQEHSQAQELLNMRDQITQLRCEVASQKKLSSDIANAMAKQLSA
eukprot:TRINITY_DN8685_c0_g2_i1.p2 TRINITY_DN8685_c0_g2~~TRINITY_DN8685_c0_g2_i1.p2  ORF type:complete len:230 (+),score=92.30 TRINITY_DN8685_c0_g2_i1:84-773(+)